MQLTFSTELMFRSIVTLYVQPGLLLRLRLFVVLAQIHKPSVSPKIDALVAVSSILLNRSINHSVDSLFRRCPETRAVYRLEGQRFVHSLRTR